MASLRGSFVAKRSCADGPQRTGQATLLRDFACECARDAATEDAIDSGAVKWGHEAQIGYFAQDHTALIREGHDGG